MRNFLGAALAFSGILFAAPSLAQTGNMYTTGTGDSMMVMGGGSADMGVPVAMTKDKCKEGGYFKSGDNMVTACAEGGKSYDLSMPESGAMMGDKPYPEGSMMMKERAM